MSDYEKLQAELSELQKKYSTLSAAYQETCTEVILEFVILLYFEINMSIG